MKGMIYDTDRHPIASDVFRARCKEELDNNGVLVLSGFLTTDSVNSIAMDGRRCQHLAHYTVNDHNVFLRPPDPAFTDKHPRNRLVQSSKGCITDDQIPTESLLHSLYDDAMFREFLCKVLNEQAMHNYADPLSSINLHYAAEGEELGWHFDNSSFAITLLIQKPEAGGVFDYVKDLRDADRDEMNYEAVARVLDSQADMDVQSLIMNAGDLVLFRGRNSLHRVTPTQGDVTRMLAVLAYNARAGVELSESARMTFYGRLG